MKGFNKFFILIGMTLLAFSYSNMTINAINVEEKNDYGQYIEIAKNLELISEADDIQYEKFITRKMFCSIIVDIYEKISDGTLDATRKTAFSDIREDYVYKAINTGIMQGKTKSLFKPYSKMTWEDAITIATETMQLLGVEQVKSTLSTELVTGFNKKIELKNNITIEEAIVLLVKMATIARNSEDDYFLDKGNYVVNGEWWHFDEDRKFVKDSTYNNVFQAYKDYVLKKDGRLFIDTAPYGSPPYFDDQGNEIIKKADWKLFELECITSIYHYYYGDLLITCLDGSVWLIDEDYKYTYKRIEFPEGIKDIKGDEGVLMALGNLGKVYFFGELPLQQEKVDTIIKISSRDNIYRGLDADGNVWEWSREFLSDEYSINEPVINKKIKSNELDYYNIWDLDLTKLEETNTIIEADDTYYDGCLVLNQKGDILFNNNSDQIYEVLPLSVKQFKIYTVLDKDGKVWYMNTLARAGGYRWMDPVPIPGMINGMLIDDRVCLRRDGSIWSWERDVFIEPTFIEHKLGFLPEELDPEEVIKVLRYNEYILILDNKGVCWYIYTYDKKKELGLSKLQEAKPLFENIKDIGYGFALKDNDSVYCFDIHRKDEEDNIQLNFVMDNIKQLVSGYYRSLVLDNNGEVFDIDEIDY
ncbi:S-layer homology domain-containing protein [Vallitalea guaymasensis]|uniref:S-layer homology domain-containing protein n=1 Tax=Vallitalea guaymasensis TaxID=1185412 RepID=UPI000DE22D2C|nr:S-layer homology domain-containing protein [Vallitalea guaymasensis]